MDERITVITDALLKAGEAVLAHDPAVLETATKSSAGDFVTSADIAAEQAIVKVIKAHFPEDIIISEEVQIGQELLNVQSLPSLRAWVIDPIDGTNNFKNDMAYSAISVAYVENGAPTIGAVYNPFRRELYIAQKGKGVSRNGQIIHVGDKVTFDAATRVCTSNAYNQESMQANMERYRALGQVWVDVLGSAVLIMTDVASGRLDLYHHSGLKPWDNAAAFLIAEQAGAKITDLHGKPVTWLASEIVMGNPILVDEFIKRTNT